MGAPRLSRKLGIAAASLFVALAGCEVAARAWLHRYAAEQEFLRYASYGQYLQRYHQEIPRHGPHWYLGYQATPGFEKVYDRRGVSNRHNSHGFRGDEIEVPKPPGRLRIACLGGSTTYTTEVLDYRKAYPHLLQEELARRGVDVDVINAGLAGWASWESFVNLQFRLLDLEPDVIVVYHAVNDLRCRLVWPPEAYRSDNSGIHRKAEKQIFQERLWERSTFLRILAIRLELIRPQKDRILALRTPLQTSKMVAFDEQWRAGTYPSGEFLEVSAEEMVATNRPIHFRRNMQSIAAIARAHGIEVVFATFAHSPHFKKSPWSASPLHQDGYAEMNAITQEIAAEMDVHLFDFARVFPRERKYYTDGIHVTELGSQLKAELFAAFLVDAGLVPGTR